MVRLFWFAKIMFCVYINNKKYEVWRICFIFAEKERICQVRIHLPSRPSNKERKSLQVSV